MKRVIIAFIMLSFAVTLAAVSSVILDKYVKSIISDIKNLQDNLNKYDLENINKQTDMIAEKWFKTEKILKLVSLKDKISPITEKIKLLHFSDIKKLNNNLDEITVLLEIFLSSEEAVWINVL